MGGMRGYKTDDWSKQLPLPVRAYRSTWFSLVTGKLYRQVAHPIGDTWVEESVGVPTLAQVLNAGFVTEDGQVMQAENGLGQLDLRSGGVDGRVAITSDAGVFAQGWMYVDPLASRLGYNDKYVNVDAGQFIIQNGLQQPMRINWSTNRIALPEIETFVDDLAAGTGGLISTEIYQTPTGELRIKL